MDINSLERFVAVQEKMYPIVMKEIQNGIDIVIMC
jgi:uncharacterized protein (DUF1810 family)